MSDPNPTVPQTPPAARDNATQPAPRPSGTPTPDATAPRTPSDVARQQEGVARESAGGAEYAVVRELARGGMGVVYEARHRELNHTVALKMVLGDATPDDRIRFLAEAQAVAAVRHENVVRVFDYGTRDGKPFMALEFCAGGTLRKLLPKERAAARAPREMAALVALVARGVAAAHAQGIVHRDLKPGNVLLDEAGVPKVADFGIAKRGGGAGVTRAGEAMGTPAYMAPEQWHNAKLAGPTADVWALGVILYEALTGEQPFTGTQQEVLAKAEKAEPVPPRKLVPLVPRDLELICLKCLSKLPHERYATAKELADDLDRYGRNEPVSVRPAGPLERAAKWVRRNKVVSAAAAAVFLALSVGLGFSVAFGWYALEQAEEADKQKKEAEKAAVREGIAATEAKNKEALAVQRGKELEQSQERLGRALAKGLLASISTTEGAPLSPGEADAMWQIAELRGTPLSRTVLAEATGAPLQRERLAARGNYLLHSLVGLDPVARSEVDRLFAARLTEPEPDSAWVVALARGELAEPDTARRALGAVRRELAALGEPSIRERRYAGLFALAARLDPASHTGALLEAHDAERDPFARARVAGALVVASASTATPDAARERIAEALFARVKEPQDTLARLGLVRRCLAMCGLLPPARAEALHARLAELFADEYARAPFAANARESFELVLARCDAPLAARARARAARALLGTVTDDKRPAPKRREHAEAAVALLPHLDASAADEVCRAVAPALRALLAAEKVLPTRYALALDLLKVAGRAERPVADELVADATRALAMDLLPARPGPVRRSQASEIDELAAALRPEHAVKVRGDAAAALGLVVVLDTNAQSRRDSALGMATLAAHLPAADAQKFCVPAARALARAYEGEKNEGARAALAVGAGATAKYIAPDEAEKLLAPVVATQLGKLDPKVAPFQLANQIDRLVPLFEALRGEQSLATHTALADLCLGALAANPDAFSASALVTAIERIATRVPPGTAAKLRAARSETLVRAIETAQDSLARDNLVNQWLLKPPGGDPRDAARIAKVLAEDAARGRASPTLNVSDRIARVAERLPETAARAAAHEEARRLVEALRTAPPTAERDVLAGPLIRLARFLTPEEANALLAPALAREPSGAVRGTLARALAAVPNMNARASSAERLRIAFALLDATGAASTFASTTDDGPFAILSGDLATVVRGASRTAVDLSIERKNNGPVIPIGEQLKRASREAATATALVGTFALPGPHALPLLHPHFTPVPNPLPAQELVELLKHPFCVGDARRAVLDALGFTYNRHFRDQWEFVEYAQQHQKQLDLLSPPKRPEQKP